MNRNRIIYSMGQAFSEPRCTCSHKRPQGALYHETHCEVLQWSAAQFKVGPL